jgi:hypothetical protein
LVCWQILTVLKAAADLDLFMMSFIHGGEEKNAPPLNTIARPHST